MNLRDRTPVKAVLAILIALGVVLSMASPSLAGSGPYQDDRNYYNGTGSGGSLRCANSLYHIEKDVFNNVSALVQATALKDLYCVNYNDVGAGLIYAQGVTQTYYGSAWHTVHDWGLNYNGNNTHSSASGGMCPIYCLSDKTQIVGFYGVNTLGAWREDIWISPWVQ